MQRRLVRDKVSELGVRFVIGIRGAHSAITKRWGGGVGPQFGGGIGGQTTHKSTSANLVILDLERSNTVARLSASASGTGDAGFIVVVPYFSPVPDTEKIVCEDIGERVVALLQGNPQPESNKTAPGRDSRLRNEARF